MTFPVRSNSGSRFDRSGGASLAKCRRWMDTELTAYLQSFCDRERGLRDIETEQMALLLANWVEAWTPGMRARLVRARMSGGMSSRSL